MAVAWGLALVLAACGSTPPSGEAAATTTTSANASPTTVDSTPAPTVDALTALACTWRWFDRYDIEVAVPDDIAAGTTIDLQVTLFEGDVSSVGATASFSADGPGVQVVQARVGALPWVDPLRLEGRRHGSLSPSAGSMCEVGFTGADADPSGYLDLVYDVDPPESDGTALGDLVATVDSSDAPMFPLAALLWLQPEPAYDRLYLADEPTLDGITFERDGTCRIIRSSYRIGANDVMVQQAHGCAPRSASIEVLDGWTTLTVPDEHWLVTVDGPETVATVIADALAPIEVPGGEAADGPPTPDADEWIDGYIAARPDITELARFDWHDGTVIAIVHRGGESTYPLEAYLEPVVFGTNANLGSIGNMCEEYTVGIASSAQNSGVGAPTTGGYAWFVARDAGTTFTLSAPGLPSTVPLRQAPSGEYVGFVDLGDIALQSSQFVVTDAAGNTVPCTQ